MPTEDADTGCVRKSAIDTVSQMSTIVDEF